MFYKTLINYALLAAIACSFTSCASIIHGRKQEVSVSTNPTGATVSDGVQSWTTPAVITLPRKRECVLTISKPGYEPQAIQLHRVISGAVAANLIAGGFIGWGVDAISGAQWRLVPETLTVQLRPDTEMKTQVVAKSTLADELKNLEEMKDKKLISEGEYKAMRETTVKTFQG
jgi:hypothetical protein